MPSNLTDGLGTGWPSAAPIVAAGALDRAHLRQRSRGLLPTTWNSSACPMVGELSIFLRLPMVGASIGFSLV